MVKGGAPARIGPHGLKLNLPLQLGNHPPPAQRGDARSPQPSAVKDLLLLKVHHGLRQPSISSAPIWRAAA
jgi:hypothetical protein